MKVVSIIIIICFFCSCAGAFKGPALTIPESSPLDQSKTCAEVESELRKIKEDVDLRTKAVETKQGSNIALGVIGLFIFWPALFAMDLSETEQNELRDWQKRHKYLQDLYLSKNCEKAETQVLQTQALQISENEPSLTGQWQFYNAKGIHEADIFLRQDENKVIGEVVRLPSSKLAGTKSSLAGTFIDKELKLAVSFDTNTLLKLRTNQDQEMPPEVAKLLADAGASILLVFPDVDVDNKTLSLGKSYSFYYRYGTEATGIFSQKKVLREFYNGGDPRAVEKIGVMQPITLKKVIKSGQ